jgi:hypothetical protein
MPLQSWDHLYLGVNAWEDYFKAFFVIKRSRSRSRRRTRRRRKRGGGGRRRSRKRRGGGGKGSIWNLLLFMPFAT